MERSPSKKILRLAPDSVFVSFVYSFFYILVVLYFSPSPSFFLKSLKARLRTVRTHLTRYPRSVYLGASLTEAYLYGLYAQHMCHTSACTFYSPLYASI